MRDSESMPDGPVRLCLATLLFHPVFAGGAMRFARYLPGLADRGVATDVLTSVPDGVRRRLSGLPSNGGESAAASGMDPTCNGARIHRVRLPGWQSRTVRDLAFARELVRFCRRPETRPDVVQLLAVPPAAVPALLRLRTLGIATVSHVTVAPRQATQTSRAAKLAYSLPTRCVDCLIVSSEELRASVAALGVTTPMVVIPNGVDTRRFRPSTQEAKRASAVRKRLGIAEEAAVALTVAAVEPRKGIDRLLEAWCTLCRTEPGLELIVAGPRSDLAKPGLAGFATRLRAVLAQSGAAERVHFVGVVDDIEAYYRAADLFVFPSRREGMPNAMLEAMASGVPVVATPFDGISAGLGRPDEHYVLVEPTAAALAHGVRHLLANAGRRAALAAAARRWIEDEMALDRALDRYADLYRTLARRASHARPENAGALAATSKRSW